jgi:hypothetical protein
MVNTTYEIKKPDGSVKAIALDFDGPVNCPTSSRTTDLLQAGQGPKGYFAPSNIIAIDPQTHQLLPSEEHKAAYLKTDSGHYAAFLANRQQLAFILNLLNQDVHIYCGSQRSVAHNSPSERERTTYQLLLQIIALLEEPLASKIKERISTVQQIFSAPRQYPKFTEFLKTFEENIDKSIKKILEEEVKHNEAQTTLDSDATSAKIKELKLTDEDIDTLYKLQLELAALGVEEKTILAEMSEKKPDAEHASLQVRFSKCKEQEELIEHQAIGLFSKNSPENLTPLRNLYFLKGALKHGDLAALLDNDNKQLLLVAIAVAEGIDPSEILHIDDRPAFSDKTTELKAKFRAFSKVRKFDLLEDNKEILEKMVFSCGIPAEYIYLMSETSASPADIKRQFLFHPLLLNKLYEETYGGRLENGAKLDENLASIKEQSPALAATLCLMHGIKLREANHYEKALEYFSQFKQWATTRCMPEDIQEQLIHDLKSPFDRMASAEYTKLCEAKIESLGSEQVLKIWYALEDQFADLALRKEKFIQALQQFPVAQQQAFCEAANKIRPEIIDTNETAKFFIESANELTQKLSTPDTADAAAAAPAIDRSVVSDISEQVRIAVLTPHVKFNEQGKVLQEIQADPIAVEAEMQKLLTPEALKSRDTWHTNGSAENLAFHLTNINTNSKEENIAKTIYDLARMMSGAEGDPLQLIINGKELLITPIPKDATIIDLDAENTKKEMSHTEGAIILRSSSELEKHFSAPEKSLTGTKLSDMQIKELDNILTSLSELDLPLPVITTLKGSLNQNAVTYIIKTLVDKVISEDKTGVITQTYFNSYPLHITIDASPEEKGASVKIVAKKSGDSVASCELKILPGEGDQAKIFLTSLSLEVSNDSIKSSNLDARAFILFPSLEPQAIQTLLVTNFWRQQFEEACNSAQQDGKRPIEPNHITAIMLELEERLIANGIAKEQVGSFIKPLAKKLERLLHPEKNQAELKKIIREQLQPLCSNENILSVQTIIPLLKTFSLEQFSQLENYANIQNVVSLLKKLGANSLDEALAYFDRFTYQLNHTIRPIPVAPYFESNRTTPLAITLRYVNEVLHNRAGSDFPSFTDHELSALLQAYEEVKPLLVGYPEGEAIVLGMSAFENMLGAEKVQNAKDLTVDEGSKARAVAHIKLAAFTPRVRFDREGKIIPMMALDPFKLKQEIEKAEGKAKEQPKRDAATIIKERDKLPPDAYQLATYDFTMPAYAEDSLKEAPELRDFSIARGSKIFLNGKEIRSQKDGDFASVSNILMQDLKKQVDNSIIEYLEAWQGAAGGGVLTSLFQNYKKAIFKSPGFSNVAPSSLEAILLEKSINYSKDGAIIQWDFIPVSNDELIIRGISDRERVCLNLKKVGDKVEITPVNYNYELSENPLRGGERYTLAGMEYKPESGKPIPKNAIRAYDYWNNLWKALPKKIEGHEHGDSPEGSHDDYSYDDVTALLIQLQNALVPGKYQSKKELTVEDRKDIIDHWAHELYALVEPKENQVLLRRSLRVLYNIITKEHNPQKRIEKIVKLYHRLDKEASFSDHISHIIAKADTSPSYALVRDLASAVRVADAQQAKVSPIAKENLYHALNEAKNLLVPSFKNSQEPIDIYGILETTGVTGEVQTGLSGQPTIDLSATCLKSLTQNYSSLPQLSQEKLRKVFSATDNSDTLSPAVREIANKTIMRHPSIAANFARQLNAEEAINLVKRMQKLATASTTSQPVAVVAKAELARSTAEQARLFGDVIGGKVSLKTWWNGSPFNPFRKPKYTVEQLKDLILADPSSLEQVFSVKAHRELFEKNIPCFLQLLDKLETALQEREPLKTMQTIVFKTTNAILDSINEKLVLISDLGEINDSNRAAYENIVRTLGKLFISLYAKADPENADILVPRTAHLISHWQPNKEKLPSKELIEQVSYILPGEAQYAAMTLAAALTYIKIHEGPLSPQLGIRIKVPAPTATASIPPTPTVGKKPKTPRSLDDVFEATSAGAAASAERAYDNPQGKRFADALAAHPISLDAEVAMTGPQATGTEAQPRQQPIAPGTASLVSKFGHLHSTAQPVADEVSIGDTNRSVSPGRGRSGGQR